MIVPRLAIAAIAATAVSCSTSSPTLPTTTAADVSTVVPRDKAAQEQYVDTRAGQSDTARYRVTFEATWSAQSHPVNFPPNAHWSGLVGGTHNSTARLWQPGSLATFGIERMAEVGAQSTLLMEVDTLIKYGSARSRLSGGGASSPGTASLTFTIHNSHPLVSLVTMVAPSPDWFTGVNGLNLKNEQGGWHDYLSVDLYGWDAGTDHGSTYIAVDIEAMPHVPITQLTTGSFSVNGDVPIVGRFIFERIDQPLF